MEPAFRLKFLGAAALSVAIACSGASQTGGSSLAISVSPAQAVADGANTIKIHVQGGASGPIYVVADRGTFETGTNSETLSSTPADLVLTTCDATTRSTCAGSVVVRAVDMTSSTAVAYLVFDCPSGSTCAAASATDGGTTDGGTTDGGTTDGGTTDGGTTDGGTAPTSYALALSTSSNRIAANGVASAFVTATVTGDGNPAQGRTVTFSQGGTKATLNATSQVTDATGAATVVLTSDPAGGTAVVTATDTASGKTASVTIVMPLLGQIQLVSAQYQVQGVRFSGYQEVNQLTFQALDTTGLAYPPGLQVNFSHQSLNGSSLGPVPSCTAAVPSICSATGVTDANGKATVSLISGRAAGLVSVQATAQAGAVGSTPQQASGTAPNLAIIGAKPSGAHLTVDCTPRNVAALSNNDCNFSHYAGSGSTVTCTATLADRFNNALGLSTLVTFQSEAGSVGPPTATPQYDPKTSPGGQTGLGVASDFINVFGGTLPVDVAPFANEISYAYSNGCGTLTHNPRDGLVTVIAMANGEEGFVDLNGNGVYDPGEPFVDMGEPYLDENDNGQWDPGEPFVDVNMNGKYDGPNGQWDANTVIWAETRVVYTGMPEAATSGGNELFSRFFAAGSPPAATATASFSVLGGTSGPSSQTFGVVFMDGNFNPIAPIATYALGTLGSGIVSTGYSVVPRTALAFDGTADDLGMTFTQQYCDKPLQPTQCSNTCTTAPCYVVTNVGDCNLTTSPRSACAGFGYDTSGQAVVKGSCSKAAGDTVQATSTLNNITTIINLPGVCSP